MLQEQRVEGRRKERPQTRLAGGGWSFHRQRAGPFWDSLAILACLPAYMYMAMYIIMYMYRPKKFLHFVPRILDNRARVSELVLGAIGLALA